MSSRRKSSTPCMVRVVSDPPERDDPEDAATDVDVPAGNNNGGGTDSESHEAEAAETIPEDLDQQTSPRLGENLTSQPSGQGERAGAEHAQGCEVKETQATETRKQPRGYECKYCPFSTRSLSDFKDHVDSSHPNVILNPLYLCAVCNFSTKKFDSLTEHNESKHPGEMNFKFKRVKMNNQTILEQTIEGQDNSVECDLTNERVDGHPCDAYPFTTVKPPGGAQPLCPAGEPKSQPDAALQKDQIAAVNINGTVIIPEPTLLQGLSHVTPLLQRPPNFNCVPKIAVPLNTTQYNPSLDSNLTLMTSFNKFPYPTHAELSWLTAASKHPEEQIKVWFTTQRLKQGITWSPEEVEEARKKMFNGSIPPAHHTFTAPLTVHVSEHPPAKASPRTMVRTTVEHVSGHPRSFLSNGQVAVTTTTTTTTRVTVGSSGALKRPLPTHVAAMFGPESKRPIMAVAPHSGDPKERGLMAPPPPRSPLKDRLPMAPPPAPMETKRPGIPLPAAEMMKRQTTAVPLMPPPMSLPPSLASKGKSLAVATPHWSSGNSKTKPAVSPSVTTFPESLTRSYIAPPPIIAPPFKNYLIPHPTSISSKEKHPITHSLLAPDLKLPNSPPHVAPQMRRPPIIQSVRSPLKAPSQGPGFPSDGQKWTVEHRGVEAKAGHPRGDKILTPLSEANGVSRGPADKRSADQNSHGQHNGSVPSSDAAEQPPAPKTDQKPKLSVPTQFPLLERMKGKTAEQLKILEENFLRNSFPTQSDTDNLAAATRLSRQEIESWFLERRALRDNLEQALLNSMGNKKMAARGVAAPTEKRSVHQQQQHQMNGVHRPSHLKSPPPPLVTRPVLTPPTSHAPSNATSCSVPADSRAPAFLKEDVAPMRWPSPEEFIQLEARTGLVRTDLIRWFGDSRATLKGSGGAELSELFRKAGGRAANSGLPAPVVRSASENASGIVRRCSEGGRALEGHADSLGGQQHPVLPDWFSSRLRQQSTMELKNGTHNGMMGGGGGGGGGRREVFGSWLEDGHSRRERDLLLDREKKLAEDTSGRLTG